MGNNRHVVWVTALRDGLSPVPVGNLFRNTTPLELEKALARNFLKDPVAMSVNGYLINTGTKLVLVAQEAADFYGRILGRLVDNLRAAGYQPEQVDEMCTTHMHSDHIGGMMAGDKLAFPNAIVRAAQRETGYGLSSFPPPTFRLSKRRGVRRGWPNQVSIGSAPPLCSGNDHP